MSSTPLPQTDLGELFSRDPRKYGEQDAPKIIEYYRNARHAFNAGNMKAGSAKQKPATAAALTLATKLDIKL